MSPTLPWEVIENVVDYSSGNTAALYSFTLTCRQLHPRSTFVLLRHIELKDRKKLFMLCALLQDKPYLQAFVRSVKVPPREFSPCPLLRMLRNNLREIKFIDEESKDNALRPLLTFHMAVQRPCREFGGGVRTLSLHFLRFSSLSAFSDIILLFPNLECLSCAQLEVANMSSPEQESVISRRLCARLRLTKLEITGTTYLLELLGEITKRMIVSLSWTTVGFLDEAIRALLQTSFLPSPTDCLHLKSLMLQVTITGVTEYSSIEHAIWILDYLRSAKLQDVTVDFRCVESFVDFTRIFPTAHAWGLCSELETILLGFPRPRIRFTFDNLIKIRRSGNAWIDRAKGYFPILAERQALSATFKSGLSSKLGHDCKITAFATSPNSKLLATASQDGFIMLWNLVTMQLSAEWLAHDFGVDALAFSSNSQNIISSSLSGEVIVWDHRGKSRVLSPARKPPHLDGYASRCSWSGDGTWMAKGSEAGFVRIWDARTLQPLHHRAQAQAVEGELQATSPDGCWVATAAVSDSDYCPCRIWGVKSGTLHQELRGHTAWVSCAAFDPGSERLVTGSNDSTIRIWDVETGKEVLLLKADIPARRIDSVAFSPDASRVLSMPFSMSRSPLGVEIWDARSGALLTCLGTPDSVTSVFACFSPCGRYLASVEDGMVVLWSTSNWMRIVKVPREVKDANRVAITPDGRVLCCGDYDGTVWFRRMRDLVPVD